MERIFASRSFSQYRNIRYNESISKSIQASKGVYKASHKTTVFLSHKHSDLEDMEDIIGFLTLEYGVDVYIDSNDTSMPTITSKKTASKLKNRIEQCDKFILLATNGAIESKWCNWELGFGDAHKYRDDIALFPIKPKYTTDFEYAGSEYLSIYPCITKLDGTDQDTDGRRIKAGYYVRTELGNRINIVPLSEWFDK